jgi:hypothetical protein
MACQTRSPVAGMSSSRVPQDDVAKIIGCAPKTLRKRFRDELDRGVTPNLVKDGSTRADRSDYGTPIGYRHDLLPGNASYTALMGGV